MKERQEVWPPAPEHGSELDGERPAIGNAHPAINKVLNTLWALCGVAAGVAAGAAYWFISWWGLEILSGQIFPPQVFPSPTPNQWCYGINVVQGIAGILLSLALMRRRIKFGLSLLIGILIAGWIGINFEVAF